MVFRTDSFHIEFVSWLHVIRGMHLFHRSKGTLPYRDTKEQSKVDPRCSLFQQALTVCLRFCEAYGSVIAYYGAAIGALGASIVIPILNEYASCQLLNRRFEAGASIRTCRKSLGMEWAGCSSSWERWLGGFPGSFSAGTTTRCSTYIPCPSRTKERRTVSSFFRRYENSFCFNVGGAGV